MNIRLKRRDIELHPKSLDICMEWTVARNYSAMQIWNGRLVISVVERRVICT
jgi:hypothetical protein